MSLKLNSSGGGSVTLQEPSTASNQTLTLPDNTGTILTTGTAGVPVNGPAFSAFRIGNQTVSASTYTKVLFTDEDFDTNNCFASSTFTPTVAGYYQINASIQFNSTGLCIVVLYKNGAAFREGNSLDADTVYGLVLSTLVYANGTTDYFEMYGNPGPGTTFGGGSPRNTLFSAFLARAA